MFDIGFVEIILISIVSLVVLGPDKLPGAIRTVSLWVGRLRRSFNNIKKDIEKEIGADEIRRQLRNEAIMEKFDKTKTQFTKTVDSVKSQTEAVKKELNLDDTLSSLNVSNSTSNDTSTTDTDRTTEPLTESTTATSTAETEPVSKPAIPASPEVEIDTKPSDTAQK